MSESIISGMHEKYQQPSTLLAFLYVPVKVRHTLAGPLQTSIPRHPYVLL